MKSTPAAVIYFDGITHHEVYCSKEHAVLQLKKAQGPTAYWAPGDLKPLDLEVEWRELFFEEGALDCVYCGLLCVLRNSITYDDACEDSARGQGITQIIDALKAVNITDLSLEETGDFTMVAYVEGDEVPGPRIGITTDCVVLSTDESEEAQERDEGWETVYFFTPEEQDDEGHLNDDGITAMIHHVRSTLPKITKAMVCPGRGGGGTPEVWCSECYIKNDTPLDSAVTLAQWLKMKEDPFTNLTEYAVTCNTCEKEIA